MRDKVLACAFWAFAFSWQAGAYAQCSTEDLDMNGIPDVCPAGSNYMGGTAAGDTLRGTNGVDCIFGYGGDDDIDGRQGDDYICAGSGADVVDGAGGHDRIFGEAGNDALDGGPGDDFINGGDGDDQLDGSAGADTLNGGYAHDTIDGGSGSDFLSGEEGDDVLIGGGGSDSLSGGDGADTLDGGGGTDSCVEEVPGTSERLTSCETVTYASVGRFDVVESGRGAMVTWETTTEVGVVAFRLWRIEAGGTPRFIEELAAAPGGDLHGGTYFVRDESAPDAEITYLLEECTMAGGSVRHGPFVRSLDPAPASHPSRLWVGRSGRIARTVPLRRLRREWPAESRAAFQTKSEDSPDAVELVVGAPGVIEVSAEEISEVLGLSVTEIEALIDEGGLDLHLAGTPVPWRSVGEGAGIRFVADDSRSPFTLLKRYLLSVGPGVRMETRELVPASQEAPHSFVETARFEENAFPGLTGNPDPRKDFYFWHALTSAAEVTISVALPSLATPSAVALRVFVHGATDHPEQAHQVELRWNGQSLGTFDLLGRRSHVLELPLDGVAATADNELVIAQHVLGVALPVVYVDAVEVDYLREARAEGPSFRFGGSADGMHTINGLTEGSVDLYDVTDAGSPVAYGETALVADGETYRLSFTEANATARFLAAGLEAVASPTEMRPHFASTLREADHDENYIIVAASHLVDEARALADLREADGYRVLLVDIDEVYWAFAGGVPDPAAIRSFFVHAWETWSSPPRYAALVGVGTFDYRDLGGLGGNWVPPMLAQADGGLVGSDSMLGDVVGDDGVPEIAIGRLPVADGDELAQVLEATRRFEAEHAEMDVLVASDDSEMREFAHATRLLRTWLPFERTHEVDLNKEALEDARARLFALWENSLSWVSFVGHGGLDRLGNEGLLMTTDLPSLSANSNPVLLGWTCNIARFDIPGFLALGHDLLVQGMSPAVFSATGWSNHHDTETLRAELTKAAFVSDAETIGEAILRAHRAASDAPVQLHRVYALLGDPALRLRAPTADRDVNDPSASGEPVAGQGDEASWGSSGCRIAPERGADPWFGVLVLVAGLWVSLRRRQPRAAQR